MVNQDCQVNWMNGHLVERKSSPVGVSMTAFSRDKTMMALA